tara:strand:- start:1487 stop:1732 length:246 start_codon:yes stop_codon:yes gene_type:complete
MAISKENQELLDTPMTITISYSDDHWGVYIDEDLMREEFENKLKDLLEIDVCKCGFCGEELEEDTRYCSADCAKADNTEGV